MKREFVRLCEAITDAIKSKDFDFVETLKGNLKLIPESEWNFANNDEIIEARLLFSYAIIKNDYDMWLVAARLIPSKSLGAMMNLVAPGEKYRDNSVLLNRKMFERVREVYLEATTEAIKEKFPHVF